MHTCVVTEDVGSDFRTIILSYFPMEHEKKEKRESLFSSAAFYCILGNSESQKIRVVFEEISVSYIV